MNKNLNTTKYYLTTPIYYVNDKPHIGHAYTTIVADVLARFYREKIGDDKVFFLTGTDEHGTKIVESAKANNLSPQKFCDQNSEEFKQAWKNLNINYNYFIRTTDKDHKNAVKKIFQKLYDNGHLEKKEYEGLYCVGCEKFLTEKELVDGKCQFHDREPENIKEENWFFKLEPFLSQLEKMIKADEICILPKSRKNETLGLIKQGVSDFSVSRQKEKLSWGVELPFDKDQVSYVWIDALSNYITAIGYPDDLEKFNQWWPADLHLMAQDILKFHAFYWPAVLLALDLPLPKKEFIHGFFTIDGQKMSKSLGNVIDPNELTKKYGVDAARYLLLSQFSFGSESDVQVERFDERYNADLANGLGNLVARVSNMIEKNDLANVLDSDRTEDKEYNQKMSACKFDEALKIIWQKIANANLKIAQQKPWAIKDKEELRKILSDLAQTVLDIAFLLKPFMPETAEKIIKQFSAEKIKKSESLFPRI